MWIKNGLVQDYYMNQIQWNPYAWQTEDGVPWDKVLDGYVELGRDHFVGNAYKHLIRSFLKELGAPAKKLFALCEEIWEDYDEQINIHTQVLDPGEESTEWDDMWYEFADEIDPHKAASYILYSIIMATESRDVQVVWDDEENLALSQTLVKPSVSKSLLKEYLEGIIELV